MRTLHFGLRVADRGPSLAFYTAVGYQVVGEVPETGIGHLTMIRLPGDEFVTIELVHDPAPDAPGAGPSHFVITVESVRDPVRDRAARGIEVSELGSPDGTDEFQTAWLTDPDGNRIELVQWPPGHPDGMGEADFPG